MYLDVVFILGSNNSNFIQTILSQILICNMCKLVSGISDGPDINVYTSNKQNRKLYLMLAFYRHFFYRTHQ